MKRLLKTPQAFFILLAILIMAVGIYKDGAQLDLNYFLAFLLVDVWSVALVSALFFVLISVNYASLSLTEKKAKKSLTIVHIVLQIIALIPLVYFMLTADEKASGESVAYSNIVLLISFFIFLVSVIVHLINFFYSLLKKE